MSENGPSATKQRNRYRVVRADIKHIGAADGAVYGRVRAWWVVDRRSIQTQFGPFDTWREAMDFADRMVL